MKRKVASLLAAALVIICGTALQAAPRKALPPARSLHTNWNTTVTRTDHDSYILGNPEAPVKLVEYISYTCPHCAAFDAEAFDQLRLSFVAQGKGSVEVRSFVRDPVDMTAAVLARCGAKEKFFSNHSVFLRTQATWAAPMINISPSERQRWFETADMATRMRYIATDFHFYEMMGTLGYDRKAVDACLTDVALANRLAQHTEEAEKINIKGTPTFMLGGIVLAGTSTWDMLRPQIAARMP